MRKLPTSICRLSARLSAADFAAVWLACVMCCQYIKRKLEANNKRTRGAQLHIVSTCGLFRSCCWILLGIKYFKRRFKRHAADMFIMLAMLPKCNTGIISILMLRRLDSSVMRSCAIKNNFPSFLASLVAQSIVKRLGFLPAIDTYHPTSHVYSCNHAVPLALAQSKFFLCQNPLATLILSFAVLSFRFYIGCQEVKISQILNKAKKSGWTVRKWTDIKLEQDNQ